MTLNILALAKQVEELIKNGGSGTSDYEQLSKKPQINGHTLIGNKTAEDLGITGGTSGGIEFNTKSGVGNGMSMGISDMVEIVDADGNFNLADDVEISVIFGKIDTTDPITPKIPSPVAEWGYTLSKNFLKEIYDGWVAAGKVSSYWNDFNQIKKGSATSMVTLLDMVDGNDQPISLYNHDVILPLQLMFSEGMNGMCVFITPNPYVLSVDANSGKPIWSPESQSSNNYGLQLFVRKTYVKPYI